MTMVHLDAGTAKLIGETIRNERLHLGITKAEAARRALLSRRTWHEIEEGTRATSTAETLTRIDRVISFREGTLFGMTARSADAQVEERFAFAALMEEIVSQIMVDEHSYVYQLYKEWLTARG